MGKSTSRKALIKKANTYMDYVEGWNGFMTSNTGSGGNRPQGSYVFPQKFAKDYTGTIGQTNRNVIQAVGAVGGLYRFPKDNGTYEYLKTLSISGQDQGVKVDYRNQEPLNIGSKAGISLQGTSANQLTQSESLSAVGVWQEQQWNGTLQNPSNFTASNREPFIVGNTPFKDDGSYSTQITMMWTNTDMLNFREVRLGGQSAFYDIRNRAVLSFYVWVGGKDMSEEETNQFCKVGQQDKKYYVPTIAGVISPLSSSGGLEVAKSRTYYKINPYTKHWEVSYQDIPLGEAPSSDKEHNYILDNVQFEDCPNNYVRIKMFLRQFDGADIYDYANWYIYPTDSYTPMSEIYTAFNSNKVARSAGTYAKLVLFGQQVEINTQRNNPDKGVIGYYHSDYIQTSGSVVTRLFEQYRLYNNIISQSECAGEQLDERSKTVYFHFYLGNLQPFPNDINFGSFNTGADNFLLGNRTLINIFPNDIEDAYKFQLSGINVSTQSDEKDYAALPVGTLKIAFNSSSEWIWINGTKYQKGSPLSTMATSDFAPSRTNFWKLQAKRYDYLLEWGLWSENLIESELKTLTSI